MLLRFGKLIALTVSVLALSASALVFFWQDDVVDWWLLRDYDPPKEIARLADDTSMNELGRRFFYVYEPQLLSSNTFRSKCTIAEKSIVLGCYVSRQGIYVYDVQDERLEGIQQVTAAHEMLHVAYERLDTTERERIDALTAQVFKQLDNERLTRTMAAYEARDPQVVPNELHSILATEVRDIGSELEAYYAQYFTNRLAIVDFAEQYEEVFETARQLVDDLDKQLSQNYQQIEFMQLQLEADARRLERERDELNRLLRTNQIDAYNDGVDVFNQGVQKYNQDVSLVRMMVEEYNGLVRQRNDAALDHQSLVDSIDSQPSTIDKKML